ncbi:MAG TPA: bifunctional (p)ppGpp synthetase/guanosine-3',5'-bis(diphosphate) 3'-pyrophosphohydrolase [Spirochaetia bacterium]|nr:bifunctional (p)ppGpp synthetase/guanosine-3',5'-bis(diphosphate) 3'-pyrophosphohydrolase [Spirochaetia bacterium]
MGEPDRAAIPAEVAASEVPELLTYFTERLSTYTEEERARILSAAEWARRLHGEQKRASGDPFFIHPLSVASILLDIHMDAQGVIAALLHDVLEDTETSRQSLRKEFGREVESLVQGVTKISVLRGRSSRNLQHAETIRKMLFAMVKDVRVILIKLADKLHNMRTLGYLDPEARARIAQETLDIYAPLAGRLGISRIKDELEDLSLKHLQPEVYEQIRHFVAQRRSERSAYLERVKEAITREADAAGIPIAIEARAKHFYSIYQKSHRRGKPLEEIYDLLGLRILCETTSQCYELVGLVHKQFMPIEGRFKDYIAMPKSNRYQSLHTTVMGFQGKIIEIQIRTHGMHQTAENGIAAHWLYKSGTLKEGEKTKELSLINKLREWQGAGAVSTDFLDEIKKELLRDSIYVFTPRGDVVELPFGSTAIDFAYQIHTDIGEHCTGAKADGAIIPLKEALSNTQVVEIMTSNTAHPRLDWLRYVKTSKARSRIKHWLAQNEPDLIFDRNIVARKTEEAQKAIVFQKAPEKAPEAPGGAPAEPETVIRDPSRVAIRIGQERNFMIRIAQCCTPSTGDAIVGYVSRGRGITVHSIGCPSIATIKDFAERSISVEWETVSPKSTRRFQVTARMTSNLFSEIEGALKKFGGHLIEGKLEQDVGADMLRGAFTVEVDNREDFGKVMKSLRTIPSVVNIHGVTT